MLKGALHTHTTCSDGDLEPDQLLAVYRGLGFDFVALTDHDFLMKPDAYANIPDAVDGMLVFKGIERTFYACGYVHVSQIFGVRETLNVFNHPAGYGFPVKETLTIIRRLEATLPIHAIEVTSNGYYTPEYDVADLPFPKVASDDAHTRDGCGRAWIEVACEKDQDAILRAIKRGEARVCYNRAAHVSGWANQGGMNSG